MPAGSWAKQAREEEENGTLRGTNMNNAKQGMAEAPGCAPCGSTAQSSMVEFW